MQNLKAGELVSLKHQEKFYVFLVLSRVAFFGCQWTFALYDTYSKKPSLASLDLSPKNGFVALVDFIAPRRNNEIVRISKNLDVEEYMSFSKTKALIRNHPFDGNGLWYIYDRSFSILEKSLLFLGKNLNIRLALAWRHQKYLNL